MAALETVPAVPILTVGTWATSTGVFAVTLDDLHAAVAAFDDPAYHRPVLKLGHVDPRFDGEPALGRLINPRVEDDHTLVVDIAGVPGWLADIMATAYPCRSIEGEFRHRTQTGTTHQFALTALSLLGVEAPAVSTLADIATLFGLDPVEVAATAAQSEEHMPTAHISASVNLETIRQRFYAPESSTLRETIGGSWAWVREVYSDFIVVDDDDGHLFRVPWSESTDVPGEVVWGDPTAVRVEYVDQPIAASSEGAPPDALRAGSLRARLAAMATEMPTADPTPTPVDPPADPDPAGEPGPTPSDVPAAEPEPTNTEGGDDVSLSEFRSRLGLDDTADEAAILAKLDERLSPQSDPQTVAAAAKHDEEFAAAVGQIQTLSQELAGIKAKSAADAKQAFFTSAINAGKIAPADRESWETRYDRSPELVTEIIGAMADGTAVPVGAARGVAGGSPDAVGTDAAFEAALARLDGPLATSGKGA